MIVRPVWANIDLGAIAHNIAAIKKWLQGDTKIMAVVKANGYGHGVEQVAKVCLDQGIDSFAVSILAEGLELRTMGIGQQVLVMGYTPPEDSRTLIEQELSQSVFSMEHAQAIAHQAKAVGRRAKVHLKVDTGMGRVGFLAHEVHEIADILQLYQHPNLEVEGIFTHFAAADAQDPSYTREQLTSFNKLVSTIKEAGINPGTVHAANSAGIIQHPESHFDLVRPGLILYGMYPSAHMAGGGLDLRPAMSFRGQVGFVKRVAPGTSISYGCTYRAPKESLIATIPVGYADGYPRILSNRGQVLIKGRLAPVVGRVCMDQIMVDVSQVPQVQVGDQVTLFGYDDYGNWLPVEQVADWAQTINYELVCKVSYRVPRRYLWEKSMT